MLANLLLLEELLCHLFDGPVCLKLGQLFGGANALLFFARFVMAQFAWLLEVAFLINPCFLLILARVR